MASRLKKKHPFGAAFLLAFCLLNIHAQGHWTSCEFPSARKGRTAIFSCHLPQDMQDGISSLLVKRFKNNKEEEIADCHRSDLNSKYKCTVDQRFSTLTQIISRDFHLLVDEVDEDLEGQYECQIPPVDHGDTSRCSFQLETHKNDVTTEESTTKPPLAKNRPRKESISSEGIALYAIIAILIIGLLAVGIIAYLYKRYTRKSGAKRESNPDNSPGADPSKTPMIENERGPQSDHSSETPNQSTITPSDPVDHTDAPSSITPPDAANHADAPSPIAKSTPDVSLPVPEKNPGSPPTHAVSSPNFTIGELHIHNNNYSQGEGDKSQTTPGAASISSEDSSFKKVIRQLYFLAGEKSNIVHLQRNSNHRNSFSLDLLEKIEK